MPRYIAFLRAINVGGRVVKMERLKSLFEALGYARVETFIASGNVIFDAAGRSTVKLQQAIEAQLTAELGYEVATFLRSPAEVAAVAACPAFSAAERQAAQALNVGFLTEPLDDAGRDLLASFATEIDAFHTTGREIYWLCRKKQSESTFNNAVFERRLKRSATFRGLKTIEKLAAKYPPA